MWTVYYVSQAVAMKTLDYSAQSEHILYPQCTDGDGTNGTIRAFSISVIDNEEPQITNINGMGYLIMLSIPTNYALFALFLSFKPFPNKPWFLRVCSRSLLKTLWEKEKLLVTSNFCYEQFLLFQKCFLLIWRTFFHFHQIFDLEESKICRLGKG